MNRNGGIGDSVEIFCCFRKLIIFPDRRQSDKFHWFNETLGKFLGWRLAPYSDIHCYVLLYIVIYCYISLYIVIYCYIQLIQLKKKKLPHFCPPSRNGNFFLSNNRVAFPYLSQHLVATSWQARPPILFNLVLSTSYSFVNSNHALT